MGCEIYKRKASSGWWRLLESERCLFLLAVLVVEAVEGRLDWEIRLIFDIGASG